MYARTNPATSNVIPAITSKNGFVANAIFMAEKTDCNVRIPPATFVTELINVPRITNNGPIAATTKAIVTNIFFCP